MAVEMLPFPDGSFSVITPEVKNSFISSMSWLSTKMAWSSSQSAGVETLSWYFRVNCKLSIALRISAVLRPIDHGWKLISFTTLSGSMIKEARQGKAAPLKLSLMLGSINPNLCRNYESIWQSLSERRSFEGRSERANFLGMWAQAGAHHKADEHERKLALIFYAHNWPDFTNFLTKNNYELSMFVGWS